DAQRPTRVLSDDPGSSSRITVLAQGTSAVGWSRPHGFRRWSHAPACGPGPVTNASTPLPPALRHRSVREVPPTGLVQLALLARRVFAPHSNTVLWRQRHHVLGRPLPRTPSHAPMENRHQDAET
ncbi:hypothetical protein ABLN73_03695, partial [Mycobacterium tuberculosis]